MKKNEEISLYVLDTHILIWYFIGSPRLPKKLKEKIDIIRKNGGRLLVPTIVLAEILDIAEKKKANLDFYRLYAVIQQEPEFEIVGFGLEIFNEALKIREIKEIHDRIIVATAKFYEAGIITKDKIIHKMNLANFPLFH